MIRPSMPAPLAPSRCGAVLAFARLVDLVGALPRPLAAGAGAVPGRVELVGYLAPREAGAAAFNHIGKYNLLGVVIDAAAVDEL